ncbi:MAG TPA: DUF4340 domain-containing protein [Anaerolineales bacterium]|nr:DUF4340 domain-containing protein [Anaerolineales bacterium]
MIRRSTWVVLLLLLALVAFAFYWNNRKTKLAASATPTPDAGASASSKLMFSAAEGAPSDIRIQDSTGQSVEIARNGAGAWVLKAPAAGQADQAAAEAAATQLSALRIISSVQLGLDVVGLEKPAYIIVVTTGDGKSHTLNVGAQTPIEDGYYATLDGGPVQIVDKQGLDALLPLVAQPPYAATPTAVVTATAVATSQPSPTP